MVLSFEHFKILRKKCQGLRNTAAIIGDPEDRGSTKLPDTILNGDGRNTNLAGVRKAKKEGILEDRTLSYILKKGFVIWWSKRVCCIYYCEIGNLSMSNFSGMMDSTKHAEVGWKRTGRWRSRNSKCNSSFKKLIGEGQEQEWVLARKDM